MLVHIEEGARRLGHCVGASRTVGGGQSMNHTPRRKGGQGGLSSSSSRTLPVRVGGRPHGWIPQGSLGSSPAFAGGQVLDPEYC